jgi:FkbM family methyltransferase
MMADLVARCFRLLPEGTKGKTRLARFLLKPHLKGRDVTLTDRTGCLLSIPSLAEPIGFHLLIDGVYERDVLEFILARLRPGGTFVDVGANIGVLALPAAKKVGPAGRVLAIEASPSVFPYLERNAAANGFTQVRCVNIAANDVERTVEFYEAPSDHFGMGSMGAQFDARPVSIKARPLDDLLAEANIESVDVLKVDVEGFELNVFRGAQRLLTSKQPPTIVFEFIDWAEERLGDGRVGAAQDFLRSLGFQTCRLKDFPGAPLSQTITTGAEMLIATPPVSFKTAGKAAASTS